MEKMLGKRNANKLLVSTLLICLSFAPLIPLSLAIPDENSVPISDDQTLIAPAPDNATGSTEDESPVLIQQRDDGTNATDSSITPTEEKQGDETNLIATNTAPDTPILLGGAIAFAAAIAVIACLATIRRRRK